MYGLVQALCCIEDCLIEPWWVAAAAAASCGCRRALGASLPLRPRSLRPRSLRPRSRPAALPGRPLPPPALPGTAAQPPAPGAQGCKRGSRRVVAAMQPTPSPIALEHRLQRGERVSAVVAARGAASMEASWPLPAMSWPLPAMSWLSPAMSWLSPSQPGFPGHAAMSGNCACGSGEVNGDGGALPRPVFIVVFLLGKKPEGLGGGGKLVGAWEKQLARL